MNSNSQPIILSNGFELQSICLDRDNPSEDNFLIVLPQSLSQEPVKLSQVHNLVLNGIRENNGGLQDAMNILDGMDGLGWLEIACLAHGITAKRNQPTLQHYLQAATKANALFNTGLSYAGQAARAGSYVKKINKHLGFASGERKKQDIKTQEKYIIICSLFAAYCQSGIDLDAALQICFDYADKLVD